MKAAAFFLMGSFLVAGEVDEFVTATIRGHITDAEGKPLAGAKVQLNRATGARMDLKNATRAISNERGEYELPIRFEPGKTLQVRELFVDLPGFIRGAPPLDLPLTAGETAIQDFQLDTGLPFSGELRLPLHSMEKGAGKDSSKISRLFVVKGAGVNRWVPNARLYWTEPGGGFSITLPSGEYTVEVGPRTGYGFEVFQWTNLKAGSENLVLEPQPFAWTEQELGKVFDDFWANMDRHYSYFFLKPDVDWNKLRGEVRPKVLQAKSTTELADSLLPLLSPLRDLHVWIETPTGRVGTFRSSYLYNGNLDVVLAQLEAPTKCGEYAVVGKTKGDGFGYFLMLRQSAASPELVNKATEAMRQRSDVPGFIVDLRRANGGSEPLARDVAKRFCGETAVYAKSKFRNGPSHEDFGKEHTRVLPASENAYTRPVVCLIGPGAVSSGEGFVKMMACLPHVTTVGARTRGASGNPIAWPLGRTGVTVFFSRWVDLMPDGQTFEGVGIPPDVEVEFLLEDQANADPTLEKGLEILRSMVSRQPMNKPAE